MDPGLKDAIDFRTRYDIGLSDAINFRNLLMQLNVLTVFKPLSEGFSGMSIKTNSHRFILINSSHPKGRQHFTICHELYHLYVQSDFNYSICETGKFEKQDDSVERLADCFSAELIIPHDGLIKMIPKTESKGKNKITAKTLLTIERHFACSRTALLYRLKKMKLINDEFYRYHSQNVVNTANALGFDTSLYLPSNEGLFIGDYGIIANELYDEEKISESHYISLLEDIGASLETDVTDAQLQ